MRDGDEATTMKRKPIKRSRKPAKTVLRIPYLEHARSAVLNSLSPVDAQRGYRHETTSSWNGIVPSLDWR